MYERLNQNEHIALYYEQVVSSQTALKQIPIQILYPANGYFYCAMNYVTSVFDPLILEKVENRLYIFILLNIHIYL